MMVVFVSHEQPVCSDLHSSEMGATLLHSDLVSFKHPISPVPMMHMSDRRFRQCAIEHKDRESDDNQCVNPVVNAFSAALICYPVVKAIARSVDLNTLHALSQTCRQIRANLMPFRHQLVRETLRCKNESMIGVSGELGEAINVQGSPQDALQVPNQRPRDTRKLTTGKVGLCARDMVSECQKCAGIVCRNCTIKPPGTAMLKNRFRRLCSTCLAAPLADHLSPYHMPIPGVGSFVPTGQAPDLMICLCEEAVWLCRPCGQILRNEDTTYKRVWTWRTRYSAYLGGGLGTGIGEGCQGVKCGRGERCLAAEDIEVEIDCEVDDWTSEHSDNPHTPHNHSHGDNPHAEGRDDEEPGYLRQEIVGVGGVVKQKVKKRVRVGACVEEHDDERETAAYLKREAQGHIRSWCGWCSHVVPDKWERVQVINHEQ